MQKLTYICALIFSFRIMAQASIVVEAPVKHLFVPEGFDNNDNVELVVTGEFPNPCYSTNKINVAVRGEDIFITISALNNNDNLSNRCQSLKVPFTELVRIGSLQAGEYNLFVNSGSPFELQKKMNIAQSNSNSIDDHLYAQVEYIDLGITGGLSGEALLIASTPSPCLVLDKVEYISNKSDTYSVLPVMKRVSQDCPERKMRFGVPVKFRLEELASSKILLFVRSLEGKSVHTIINKN